MQQGINRAAWEGQRPNNSEAAQAGRTADTRDLSGDSLSRAGDGRRAGSELFQTTLNCRRNKRRPRH